MRVVCVERREGFAIFVVGTLTSSGPTPSAVIWDRWRGNGFQKLDSKRFFAGSLALMRWSIA